MPAVWRYEDRAQYGFADEKTYTDSGIALRKTEVKPGVFETRMLAVTGTYAARLYEVEVPRTLGKIVGNEAGELPVAQLTINFSGQSDLRVNVDGGSEGWGQGSMWFDAKTELLYWTNNPSYPADGFPSLPMLYYARLDFKNRQVVNRKGWQFPSGVIGGAQFGSFTGGVTVAPDSFANKYLDGRKLILGFGGGGSIITTRSLGPSLGAVSTGSNGAVGNDLLPVMYYQLNNQDASTHCVRDGNYLSLYNRHYVPSAPWDGRWTDYDIIRSGVFIEYGGKKGYMTFAHQATGRINYDFGGVLFFPKTQNAWYFYDIDDLGRAAKGEIPKTEIKPSSFNIVEYPITGAVPHADMRVTGSCFDSETGLLYLYVRRGYNRIDPVVHIYKVII
jgi:hypothetical protein